MKSLIFSYFLLIIASVNTYFLYFYEGFEPTKSQSMEAFIIIGVLILIGVFLLIYHNSNRRKTKKIVLRLSLLLSLVLFISSLLTRVIEPFDIPFIIWRWSQTLLYGLIFLSIFVLTHNFYHKLLEISRRFY